MPSTGKCLEVNSSHTLMLKQVNCLEERASPLTVPVVGPSPPSALGTLMLQGCSSQCASLLQSLGRSTVAAKSRDEEESQGARTLAAPLLGLLLPSSEANAVRGSRWGWEKGH